MCGIAGVLFYPKQRDKNEMLVIHELINNLAVEIEARGTHATGIASLGRNGHNVFKSDIRASTMVTTDTWNQFLRKNVTNETYNVLLHTRLATQGSVENNDNNHPIITATAIGVHNGMIYNDNKLFKKEGLFRQAQVDSEVIFRLVDKEKGNEKENIKNVAEKLSGAYAVAYVRKDNPHILNYFRNNNPTTFAYIPQFNIIIFASLRSYIEKAIDITNAITTYAHGITIDKNDVYLMTPEYNTILQFDTTVDNALEQLNQIPMVFQESNSYSNSYYPYYYDYGYWGEEYDDYVNWASERNDKVNKEEKQPTDIYAFLDSINIQYLMSDEDFGKLLEYIDLQEKNEWQRGFSAGRESLDNEIQLLREQIRVLEGELNKVIN